MFMYLAKLLTQEELPTEPGSGSEGSSAVESTSIASMDSSTGLLCTSLMPLCQASTTSSEGPSRSGAAPPTMTVHGLCNDLGTSCYAANRKMTSRQPPK